MDARQGRIYYLIFILSASPGLYKDVIRTTFGRHTGSVTALVTRHASHSINARSSWHPHRKELSPFSHFFLLVFDIKWIPNFRNQQLYESDEDAMTNLLTRSIRLTLVPPLQLGFRVAR